MERLRSRVASIGAACTDRDRNGCTLWKHIHQHRRVAAAGGGGTSQRARWRSAQPLVSCGLRSNRRVRLPGGHSAGITSNSSVWPCSTITRRINAFPRRTLQMRTAGRCTAGGCLFVPSWTRVLSRTITDSTNPGMVRTIFRTYCRARQFVDCSQSAEAKASRRQSVTHADVRTTYGTSNPRPALATMAQAARQRAESA